MIPLGIQTQTQWVFKALAFAAVLAAAFGAGWAANGWRLGEIHQTQRASAALAVVDELHQRSLAQEKAGQQLAELQHAHEVENVRNAGAVAAARRDADGVRQQLATALRAGPGLQDSLAACQQRAEAAGQLLGDGLRVQGQLAGEAESLASDVRALRGSDKVIRGDW